MKFKRKSKPIKEGEMSHPPMKVNIVLVDVVGQSEQLPCDCEKHKVKSKLQDFCGKCGTTLL